jgi:hypothetical protein
MVIGVGGAHLRDQSGVTGDEGNAWRCPERERSLRKRNARILGPGVSGLRSVYELEISFPF